jgi:hypothetical protein
VRPRPEAADPAASNPTHPTQVALLHLWTLVKNASGYNACVGTVFNCPGAYDGTKAYTTSDVVEIQVCMCACVHVCMYCVHVHVCACACVHCACVHVCMCACVHVCMCYFACACVHGTRTPTTDLDPDRHPGPQVLTY